jgi:hypothetical protein
MYELDGPAVSTLWRAFAEVKQRWSVHWMGTKGSKILLRGMMRNIRDVSATPSGINNTVRAPCLTLKWSEVVGKITHADALHRGIAPHSTLRPACVYHALQQSHMKLFIACATHAGRIRMREQSA